MHNLVVGIDPGLITAYAALTLDGKLVCLYSRRGLAFKELLREIFGLGKPVIVATDMPKVPKLVERFSKKTGSVAFAPSSPVSEGKKREIVRDFNEAYSAAFKNRHELSALFASVLACKRVSALVNKVRQLGLPPEKESQLLTLVLTKKAKNIEEARRLLSARPRV